MKYFGTDGIRGYVNSKNINGDMFFKFGLAAGKYFTNLKKKKQTAIIAKDTRLSGYALEPALVSGLASAGMHVFTLGPLPTNGLAMLTKSMNANLGIMITASHNLFFDNGLKLFGPDGLKLSDKIQKKIEKLIDKKVENHLSDPKLLGRVQRLESGTDKYIEILRKNVPNNFKLNNMKIVLDCANGAGYKSAPKLIKSLGAKVIVIGNKPNGFNINKNCGSTFPNKLQRKVKKHNANLGISLDGDADRIIMCDEKGLIIDPPPTPTNANKDYLYKIKTVDIALNVRSTKKFFRKAKFRKFHALNDTKRDGTVNNSNTKSKEDRYLRDTIVVTAYVRNLGLQ